MAGEITPEIHVAHVKHRQFRLYNVLVIFAMAFASMAMGYSACIIATTCKLRTNLDEDERLTCSKWPNHRSLNTFNSTPALMPPASSRL